MNETDLLREMTVDLQRAPAQRVVYLEGKTDLPIFFALLGVTAPRDGVHGGVLVRGLKDTSSGGSAMRASLDDGHTLVNGKWLVDVFAPRKLGKPWNRHTCRDAWIAHAASTGGLAEVRGLWERITGRPA